MFLMNKFGHSTRPERVYFYLYMVLVVALMFYISLRAAPFIFGRESGKCIVLSGPCVYEVSDGSTGEISLPDRLAVPEGTSVTVTTVLPERIGQNDFLAYYPYHQTARVYIDGRLRAGYDGTPSVYETDLKSKGMRFLPLSEEDAAKTLSVTYTSILTRYIGVLNEFMVGDRMAALQHAFRHGYFVILSGILLLFFGLSMIGVGAAEQRSRELFASFGFLGFLSVFAGIWCVLQTNMGQVFFTNTAWLQWMETFSLSMLPFAMSRFMDLCERRRFGHLYDVWGSFNLAVVVCDLVASGLDYDMLHIVWLVHLSLFGTVAIGLGTVIYLQLKDKTLYTDIRWVAVGIVILAVSGLAEMGIFYVSFTFQDGTFFVVGVLTFLLCSFIWVCRCHIRFATEEEMASEQGRMRNTLLENISNAVVRPVEIIRTQSAAIASTCESDVTKRCSNEIHDEAIRILSLLDDILDYVKLETGMVSVKQTPYETETLVRAIRRRGESFRSNQNVVFECRTDPRMPKSFMGDFEKIKRVVNTLISSSLLYTKEGLVRVDLTFAMAGFGQGGDLIITVQDTGGGIPENISVSRVFTLDTNAGGNGPELTLSVAGALVHLMGGEIRVKETGGSGTVVVMSLPQQILDATPIGMKNGE